MDSEYSQVNQDEDEVYNLRKDLQLDDFVLLGKLGSGGMGEVWKARQLSIDRNVALKILSPRYAQDEGFVERFLNEATMTGRLQHPNIITAYTAGNSGIYYYLATLFVDGIELQDKIRIDGMLPEREALNIIRTIASALCYTWEHHQMLHCDIKPANIMIDRHRIPFLMDMGISKIFSENEPSPDGSVIIGSPQYMSPEQSLGSIKLDLRTDIYSLGVTLYEMVTAILPFSDKIVRDAILKKTKKNFPPPKTRNPYLTEGCSALITKMLSNDREDRQGDWNYVLADIDSVLAGTYSDKKKVKAKQWNKIKSKKQFNINAEIALGKKEKTEELSTDTQKITTETQRIEPVEQIQGEAYEPPPVIFDASKERHSSLKLLILTIICGLIVLGTIVYFYIKYFEELKQFWMNIFVFWV